MSKPFKELVPDSDKLKVLIANEANKSKRASLVSIKTDAGLRLERRRSSVGSLVQFVNAETGKSHTGHNTAMEGMFGRDAGVSEAIERFQFRSVAGPQISAKGQLPDDPDRLIAASKRKRMVEYNVQRKATNR